MYKGLQQWSVPKYKCEGIMKIPITKHIVMPEVYAYSIQQVMMKLTWHVNCHDQSQIFTTGKDSVLIYQMRS